jgi:hypothetical protein
MRTATSIFLSLILALSLPLLDWGQSPQSSQPANAAQATTSSSASQESGVTYHETVFLPSYRFVSPSGFAGRVAEYDSLDQSVGGELSWAFVDHLRENSWKFRANFLSRDDYELHHQLRFGGFVTLSMENRSMIRHLENVPLGTIANGDGTFSNIMSPDDIGVDVLPDQALYGVQRRMNAVRADIKIPKSPVSFYVKGNWGSRNGMTNQQHYDMASNTTVPPVCGESCHQYSQYRSINYTTRGISGGLRLKIRQAILSFEHSFRSFHDRLPNPVSQFGAVLGSEEEPLPPGVPDTLPRNYIHNVLPSHRTFSDALRLQAPLTHGATFTGDISYGHTRNEFTGNPNRFLNANAAFHWNPFAKLRTIVDFHQQNQINKFEPSSVINGVVVSYNLFGNPSFHRYWTGVSTDYELKPWMNVETYYKRENITRSNSFLWPQIYSPNSVYSPPNSTVNGPFVPGLIPSTSSNVAGADLRFHKSARWNIRTGYEWIGTHSPGYLIDPGTAHRTFLSTTFVPRQWLSFSNDFSVLLQGNFSSIQRKNRLYLNTSYLTLTPWNEWSLSLGYAYYQNNMATDVIYGTDTAVAFYAESLLPYKALSQSYSVGSTYNFKKRLFWRLDFSHIASHSEIRPSAPNPADCAAQSLDCSFSVAFARSYSNFTVPQILSSSSIDYRWARGISSGFRFQYDSYTDRGASLPVGPPVPLLFQGLPIRSDLSGRLRTYSVFVGRAW